MIAKTENNVADIIGNIILSKHYEFIAHILNDDINSELDIDIDELKGTVNDIFMGIPSLYSIMALVSTSFITDDEN